MLPPEKRMTLTENSPIWALENGTLTFAHFALSRIAPNDAKHRREKRPRTHSAYVGCGFTHWLQPKKAKETPKHHVHLPNATTTHAETHFPWWKSTIIRRKSPPPGSLYQFARHTAQGKLRHSLLSPGQTTHKRTATRAKKKRRIRHLKRRQWRQKIWQNTRKTPQFERSLLTNKTEPKMSNKVWLQQRVCENEIEKWVIEKIKQ